ncbi:adenylate/guanylate cyclase domain-containing protein [Lentzea flava]|uniref:Adenylate cyclase n=1 Tax=Lentzea flava TaxID=103732 RepID=A0ABQ2UHK3_9PSEU|nr:adenylate/guanylate cyclase domain-containing protein [Lentzea flava]MCP2198650.1 Adenylate and Guanylate cyclase catalytic domain-containing protein [Lentzea flava]GGU29118.1 adenylate cyclase [Lentzea flava]
MEATNKSYDYIASFGRIDGILATPQSNYEEVDTLPARDKLTYSNGFYANKTVAVFVDIRDSSKLPEIYKRPKLARLYRAYISEMVAILNSHAKAVEVNIVGDGVWSVINAPYKADIDEVLEVIARMNALMKVLNYKLGKADYSTPIKAGIGAAFGRALMIKAGLSGSGINDVVYMGDVVNHAAKLAAKANAGYFVDPIFLSNDFVGNLKEEYQGKVKKDWSNNCYTCDLVNSLMNDWYDENCN